MEIVKVYVLLMARMIKHVVLISFRLNQPIPYFDTLELNCPAW